MNLRRGPSEPFFFSKLNGEVNVMSHGLPFTIVKPCTLNDKAGGQEDLVTGPADTLKKSARSSGAISRADLAKMLVQMATASNTLSHGLRFDICGGASSGAIDLDDAGKVDFLLKRA